MRTTFFFLLMLSIATVVTVRAADAAEPEATPAPDAEAEGAAAEAEVELPPLQCTASELLDNVDKWSVDCAAMWLENLGFPELRGAFMGNKVDGKGLKELTIEKLADDYGVSDEEQRKKIYYSLKDVMKKDDSAGNLNSYTLVLLWILPFLGLYKYLSVTYDKQIEKAMKKYKKWQDQRNPPKPVETVVYEDGTNEWISGLNGDVGGAKAKAVAVSKKKDTPKSDKKKKPMKAE